MQNLIVPANLIRAAMTCINKKEHREYLRGVYIGVNGDVVGTDGHVLFRGELPEEQRPETDLLLEFGQAPTTKAATVDVRFNDDGKTGEAIFRPGNGKLLGATEVTVQDAGRYPTYTRVIPKIERWEIASGICLNTSLLALIEKVFGKGAFVTMYMGTEKESILLKGNSRNEVDGEMVVMPAQKKRRDEQPTFNGWLMSRSEHEKFRHCDVKPEAVG